MKTSCAATVFPVKDVNAAVAYYTGVFGFMENFRLGTYAGIKCGDVLIHLSEEHPGAPGSGSVYIFCDEVDEYYLTITAKGAKTLTEPKDWPYGMRDFTAFDVDGNQVSFGMEAQKD